MRQNSYRAALQIDRYPRIYFLKEQKPLFLRIVRELSFLIEAKYELRYEEVVSLIHEDDQFDTMRVAEPDIFEYKWQPIIQFTKPAAMSRMREAKHRYSHCFQKPNFSLIKMYFTPVEERALI